MRLHHAASPCCVANAAQPQPRPADTTCLHAGLGHAQGPGDGMARALDASGEEDTKLAGQRRVGQRRAHSVAQAQQVRRHAAVLRARRAARLHLRGARGGSLPRDARWEGARGAVGAWSARLPHGTNALAGDSMRIPCRGVAASTLSRIAARSQTPQGRALPGTLAMQFRGPQLRCNSRSGAACAPRSGRARRGARLPQERGHVAAEAPEQATPRADLRQVQQQAARRVERALVQLAHGCAQGDAPRSGGATGARAATAHAPALERVT